MNLLAKAISIAAQAFENKLDKGGRPYILHCLWVMNNVRHLGEDAMICAVLHDLVEDTYWTLKDLKAEKFKDLHVDVISLLTHAEHMSYEDYIKRICGSTVDPAYEIARQIKLKDLEHNMKPNRLKNLTKKDHDRMDKYMRWYTYLSKI